MTYLSDDEQYDKENQMNELRMSLYDSEPCKECGAEPTKYTTYHKTGCSQGFPYPYKIGIPIDDGIKTLLEQNRKILLEIARSLGIDDINR